MQKKWYIILNLTWGCIMTAIGFVASTVIMALGYKPKQHKLAHYFLIPGKWGGITLGTTIIVCNETQHLLDHEFGHTLQNALFGIFMPFIGIASFVRATMRRIQQKKGKLLPPYDSVWFERQATEWGTNYTEERYSAD